MKAATVHEIKKELVNLDPAALVEICLRLAKFKKDNKELLTYLLYEEQDEKAFILNVKAEMDEEFKNLPTANLYYFKKSLRRVLRLVNKQIRYSGQPITELELRLHFCTRLNETGVDLDKSPVVLNLYRGQVKKISGTLAKLPEDLQFDYQQDIKRLA